MGCSSLSGTRYNNAQLQGFLRQAGWPEDKVPIMAAIGMAESSGYAGAANLCGEHSIGIWQINRNAHRQYSEAELKDPLRNAQAALVVYRAQGLRAWGAYTNGSYRRFLTGANNSANNVQHTGGAANGTDPAGASAHSSITQYLPLALGFVLLFLLIDD